MEFQWTFSEETIDWAELSNLYKIAPLGEKNPDDLQKAFNNSRYKCFIFKSTELVSAGRALADGIDCSYICDVAVLPKYQGCGLGKKVIEKLLHLSTGHKKIILYSALGKESFYKKLGFKRMNTAMAIFDDQEQVLYSGLINET